MKEKGKIAGLRYRVAVMDKASKMDRASATGSFQLFIGKIVSTVILAVGTIILGIFILEGDYGLYAIALIPAITMLLFQDWGIDAAIATYLFLSVLNAANWVLLVTGMVLFLAVYLTAAPLIGAINQTDINNLRAMFSGLGVISKLLEIPLTLVEKPLKTRDQHAELKKQQN